MSTYCIADIHGCYDEFMELLENIKFATERDTLYILGDAVDRGPRPLDCLHHIVKTENIHFIIGNHEHMMLDFYAAGAFSRVTHDWWRNGCETTMKEMDDLPAAEQLDILAYLKNCPYYATVTVDGKPYFLSHSGLNAALPFDRQDPDDFVWSRDEFYDKPALATHYCIFGHTPTIALHGMASCAVWLDKEHNDKMCIDCGCVYGGALAALRLDDSEVFYVKSADPARKFADVHW